ncbi:MAG: translation initiation factor [Phycisphaera sp.]|nr:MAG: translation initiation factor [Phycisphaera sp.]
MAGLFDGTALEQPVTCERCGKAVDGCACPKVDPRATSPRVRREKRRGKWNTIVGELGLPKDDAKALLKDLRTAMGTGGGLGDTPQGVEIVLQGDHREAVVERLKAAGYKAKAAGG